MQASYRVDSEIERKLAFHTVPMAHTHTHTQLHPPTHTHTHIDTWQCVGFGFLAPRPLILGWTPKQMPPLKKERWLLRMLVFWASGEFAET